MSQVVVQRILLRSRVGCESGLLQSINSARQHWALPTCDVKVLPRLEVSGSYQRAGGHDSIITDSALPQLPLERQPSSLEVESTAEHRDCQRGGRHDGIFPHSALPQLPLERQPSSLLQTQTAAEQNELLACREARQHHLSFGTPTADA